MSLYRQAGQARRRRRLSLGIGVATVVAIVVVVLLLGDSGPPSKAERAGAARASATRVLDELEVLGIEYRQAVSGGRVVAPTEYAGSKGHVQRMRSELAGHTADYDAVDAAARRSASSALSAIAQAVDQRAPITRATAALRAALQRFT